MSPTRREFLKGLGIALASLVMARCAPFREGGNSERQRLRDCWLRLDWLAEQAQQGDEEGKQAKEELTTEHRAALDGLIASGELDKEVAYHIQYAFAAAADDVFASSYSIMCYKETVVVPTPTGGTVQEVARGQLADYQSRSAERLVRQADLLSEMAGQSGIDANTVARAQQAIQWDLYLLSSTPEERKALADRLVEVAGGTHGLPPLYQWDVALPPDVAKAARFLAELLLEEPE
jgi:hypothetical protein